jgi:hypothetical protein
MAAAAAGLAHLGRGVTGEIKLAFKLVVVAQQAVM